MDYDDDELEEREPVEVETATLDEPGPCIICGRPGRDKACFRCGMPVCYNLVNYWESSKCGGWILDSWHPGHPEDNEFYCSMCLCAGLVPPEGVSAGGMLFKYTGHQTVQVTINDQLQELSLEETKDLVAYLFCERGELFGKPYDPDAPEEEAAPEPVTVGSDQGDGLGDLDGEPF